MRKLVLLVLAVGAACQGPMAASAQARDPEIVIRSPSTPPAPGQVIMPIGSLDDGATDGDAAASGVPDTVPVPRHHHPARRSPVMRHPVHRQSERILPAATRAVAPGGPAAVQFAATSLRTWTSVGATGMRARPSDDAPVVAVLSDGQRESVLGRVPGTDWYAVEWGEGAAFVRIPNAGVPPPAPTAVCPLSPPATRGR